MSERGRMESEVKDIRTGKEGREAGEVGRVRWENKIPSMIFFYSFIRRIFIVCFVPGVMLVLSIR